MKTILNPDSINKEPLYYSDALKMIAEYSQIHESDEDFLASEYYDAQAISRILSNPKCKGIRIFNAVQMLDGQKQNRMILIGVDENGKAILNFKAALSSASVASVGASIVLESMPLENGTPCPPMCG
jgi:hypothetical protein